MTASTPLPEQGGFVLVDQRHCYICGKEQKRVHKKCEEKR